MVNKNSPRNNKEQAKNFINSPGFSDCKGLAEVSQNKDDEALIKAEYHAFSEKITIILLVYIYPLNPSEVDNRSDIRNEERGELESSKGSYSYSNSYVLFKGIFVQRGVTTSTIYLTANESGNCNGNRQSDILAPSTDFAWQSDGRRPEILPNNFDDNRNCAQSYEREIFIEAKESSSSCRSYILNKCIFDQRSSMNISASPGKDRSGTCNVDHGTDVRIVPTAIFLQMNRERHEIFLSNSAENTDDVELNVNLNDAGFEKSGLESFFVYAHLYKKFVILLEEYIDDKINKKASINKHG